MNKREFEKLLKAPERHMPYGAYCYEPEKGETKNCPFWEIIPDKPPHDNGYCHFLKRGDWDKAVKGQESLGLLWDQVGLILNN